MQNQVAQIQFTPCTGFGTADRTATLYTVDRVPLGTGHGETDDEAVCEALCDAGLSFDAAFDIVGAVMKSAAIVRA